MNLTGKKVATCLLWLMPTLGILTGEARAIVISDAIENHFAEPGTTPYGMNLDGVVRLELEEQICSAALITDRHLLSAAHCFSKALDSTITFPSETTGAAVFERIGGVGTVTYRFAYESVIIPENWAVQSADIAVIRLSRVVPEEFPRYPLYGGRDEIGSTIVLAGYGCTGVGSTDCQSLPDGRLAGLNRYESAGEDLTDEPLPLGAVLVYDFDSGVDENNTLGALGIESDLGFGIDEAASADGDSGAPVFINGAIAGIVSFSRYGFTTDLTPDRTDSSWGELGFDTRVSSFKEFLLTATDGEVVFVPEPQSQLLLVVGIVAVCLTGFARNLRIRRDSRLMPRG